jgi:hypothetical protein
LGYFALQKNLTQPTKLQNLNIENGWVALQKNLTQPTKLFNEVKKPFLVRQETKFF